MIKTKTWMIIILAVLFCCTAAAAFIMLRAKDGHVANVYVDGECVYSVDLQTVTKDFEKVIDFGNGRSSTLLISQGKICVKNADCPDKVCVKTGWISNLGAPIVCLPNKLVIQIVKEKEEESDFDSVVK